MQYNKNGIKKFYMRFLRSKGESQYSNIDNSSMANSTQVSKSSCHVIFSTFTTPNLYRCSKEPERGKPPLVINKSLALMVWKVTGRPWLSQAFQNELPILSLIRRDKVHQLITTRPGKNRTAGVIGNKLIHFDVL